MSRKRSFVVDFECEVITQNLLKATLFRSNFNGKGNGRLVIIFCIAIEYYRNKNWKLVFLPLSFSQRFDKVCPISKAIQNLQYSGTPL